MIYHIHLALEPIPDSSEKIDTESRRKPYGELHMGLLASAWLSGGKERSTWLRWRGRLNNRRCFQRGLLGMLIDHVDLFIETTSTPSDLLNHWLSIYISSTSSRHPIYRPRNAKKFLPEVHLCVYLSNMRPRLNCTTSGLLDRR